MTTQKQLHEYETVQTIEHVEQLLTQNIEQCNCTIQIDTKETPTKLHDYQIEVIIQFNKDKIEHSLTQLTTIVEYCIQENNIFTTNSNIQIENYIQQNEYVQLYYGVPVFKL